MITQKFTIAFTVRYVSFQMSGRSQKSVPEKTTYEYFIEIRLMDGIGLFKQLNFVSDTEFFREGIYLLNIKSPLSMSIYLGFLIMHIFIVIKLRPTSKIDWCLSD